jgi:hypothetical protein
MLVILLSVFFAFREFQKFRRNFVSNIGLYMKRALGIAF